MHSKPFTGYLTRPVNGFITNRDKQNIYEILSPSHAHVGMSLPLDKGRTDPTFATGYRIRRAKQCDRDARL